MSEFSRLQDRIKLNNILGYLIYGTEDTEIGDNTYQSRIDNAYEKIFSKIEQLFPSASRKNDNLYGAVLEFSITHNEVYLEMGVIIGFQIYQILEKGFANIESSSLQSIVKQLLKKRAEMEDEDAGR